MNFSLRVALKYVFSKSKKSIVNRINRFSIITLIISSTSLLVVLSGFEGLKNFGMSLYGVFEPDFSIVPKQGKKITILHSEIEKVNSLQSIISASGVIEEKVFLSLKQHFQQQSTLQAGPPRLAPHYHAARPQSAFCNCAGEFKWF